MIDTDRLKQAVNELNMTTEALGRVLESIEKEIKEIGPGLIVWVTHLTTKYGYYRFDDGWHLAVLEDGKDAPKEVLKASRFHRYMCFKMRQQIVDALYEASMAASKRWKKALEGIEEDANNGHD